VYGVAVVFEEWSVSVGGFEAVVGELCAVSAGCDGLGVEVVDVDLGCDAAVVGVGGVTSGVEVVDPVALVWAPPVLTTTPGGTAVAFEGANDPVEGFVEELVDDPVDELDELDEPAGGNEIDFE
jgi:hypothetical protein